MKTIRAILRKLKLARRIGSTYHCPFCGFSSNALSEVGVDASVLSELHVIGGGKRNGGCYKCSSVDRVRLVYLYLRDEFKLFDKSKDLSILHFAPEKHISEKIMAGGFKNYLCADLFAEGYSYPSYVQNINLLNMNFPENSFDLVICNHVLEHIPNDYDAMKALFNVLKPGGTAILQVPISSKLEKTLEDPTITTDSDRLRVFGQYDHVRIYGQDYPDRLTEAGFHVTRSTIGRGLSKYGVIADEDLFIATKLDS